MKTLNYKKFLLFAITIILALTIFNKVYAEEGIMITEIIYSPSAKQWVEIWNGTESEIDLTQYKILDAGAPVNGHGISAISDDPTILPAKSFAVVAKTPDDFAGAAFPVFKSALGIKASGDTVILKDKAGEIFASVAIIPDMVADGQSLQFVDSAWMAGVPTPGESPMSVAKENQEAEEDSVGQENEEGGEKKEEQKTTEEVTQEEQEEEQTEEILTDPEVVTVYEDAPEVIETVVITRPNPNPPLRKISINEINWTGAAGNQYGEWLELYNPYSLEIDLAGWKLYKAGLSAQAGGEVLVFTLNGKIAPHSYYAVERATASAQDPLPEIDDDAGKFGGGGFSNKGEFIVLKDNLERVVESLDFSAGWPAGDNATKETMQRDRGEWFTSPGTPKAANVKIIKLEPVKITQTVYQDAPSEELGPETPPEVKVIEQEAPPEIRPASLPKTEPKAVKDKAVKKEITKDEIKKEPKKNIEPPKIEKQKIEKVKTLPKITASVIDSKQDRWIENVFQNTSKLLSRFSDRFIGFYKRIITIVFRG